MLRLTTASLLCSLALLLLPASPRAATAEGGGDSDFGLIGRTALAAAAATNSGGAFGAIDDGVTLLDAWLASKAASERTAAEDGAEAVAPSSQPPSTGQGADGEFSMPPASAGTNGSPYDHPTAAASKVIVAHSLTSVEGEDSGPITTLVSGVALAPPSAPEPIQRAINSANMISRTPYIWGGGHQSWYSNGYDCSGAVSFALYGAGMLSEPLASGQLADWGVPGPGRWLTVYANAGHAYAVIAGLRWDTVGNAKGSGPRWHPNKVPPAGFVARHFPGY